MINSLSHGVTRLAAACAAFFFLTVYPLINKTLESLIADTNARYSMMGIIAYGFPFATVKSIISKIALNALKEFANIIDEDKHL